MSFTSTVKNEISNDKLSKTSNVSELSALVKTLGTLDENSLILMTENVGVANHIYHLFQSLYDINAKIIVRNGYNFNRNYIYLLEITHKLSFILDDLSIEENGKILSVPKEYIIADEDLVRAYLRGVFLGIGSINDPSTSRYHLEFVVDDKRYADFLSQLLNSYQLNSKVIKRDNKYMIYMKEAEKIGDFLKLIRANKSVLYYENIRIYRESKNIANRLNNCEQANVDKMVQSAADLINDINLLEEVGALELLDEKVYEAAIYRRKYPDVSIAELSQIISLETSSKITKSGLHHRFQKIKDLAKKVRSKENK